MSIKAKLEALIYAAEEPVTLDQMAALLKDDLLALKVQPDSGAPEPDAALTEEAHPENAEEHPATAENENGAAPAAAAQSGNETSAGKQAKAKEKSEKAELRGLLKPFLEELIAEYEREEHGIEVRQVAGGYRMSTKPEHHDVVRAFSKSLKPPVRLSLQALETLAVIAYKQPVTVPEISDIRGVDSSGVIGTLLDRKLITTAGRKQVVGRPILYKTTKDFLLRFGLKDISELPSMEEFEKLATDQADLFSAAQPAGSAAATQVSSEATSEGASEEAASEPAA